MVRTPADNARSAFDALERLYSDADEAVRRLAAIHGARLACRPGCGQCCVDGMTVFAIEAGQHQPAARAASFRRRASCGRRVRLSRRGRPMPDLRRPAVRVPHAGSSPALDRGARGRRRRRAPRHLPVERRGDPRRGAAVRGMLDDRPVRGAARARGYRLRRRPPRSAAVAFRNEEIRGGVKT